MLQEHQIFQFRATFRELQNIHIATVYALFLHQFILTKFKKCTNMLSLIRILYIVSVMVAIKYYDDEYYKNEYYAKVGGLSLKEINQLELEFLDLLNYELFIEKEVFEVYEERLQQYDVTEI